MNKVIKLTYSSLVDRIAQILVQARNNVVRQINLTQVLAYWEIGREIVEFEQKGKARAEYGENLLMKLSADMTAKFGRGFSAENLRLMRKFYITFRKSKTLSWKSDSEKYQTLSVKSEKPQTLSAKFEQMLSWSHYCELLRVEESLARSFYEQEAIEIIDSVEKKLRILKINYSHCIYCGQCEEHCITEKGIKLSNDYITAVFSSDKDADTMQIDKELLICQNCGSIIGCADHLDWIIDRLGPKAYGNPNLLARIQQRYGEIPESKTKSKLRREDYYKLVCPKCRHQIVIKDVSG